MGQATPVLGLTITYWLHMLASVVWIGGLSALVLLVLPAAHKTLEPQVFVEFMGSIQQRLDPLAWFCLLVLLGTGLFQMSEHPNYRGFLSIQGTWAAAILVKHLVFFLMIGVSAWSTWGVLPALRRATLRLAVGMDDPGARHLQQRSLLLLRVNLMFSVLVLALTALARVS